MGGVPGQEDPSVAEPVGERGTRPEVGGPEDLRDVLRVQVRACGDHRAHPVRGGVRLTLLELRDQLEVPGAGQRAQREEPRVGAHHVPVEPVERVLGDPDIGHQHRCRVHRLPGHRDGQGPPHGGASAVRRDQVGGADRAGGQLRGDPVRVLGEPGQRGREHHVAAQFAQPGQQDLLGAPLRHQPRLPVRLRVRRRRDPEHVVLAHPLTVLPDHPDRRGAPVLADGVADPEVVEDLPGAGLDALAARAGEEGGRLLDEERGDAAPGQVTGQGEAAGTRADDEDRGLRDRFLNAVKFHASQCVLNAVKLSRAGC